ncbi:MAG: serine/threonine-protein kinase, partial [Gemmatimonadetes bacterium]|nr:serine/threonine-protein kinase [Gemmatimonadota bacterium]
MSDAVERLNAALEGRYAIERELGEGGMATVYLADDLKHERKVALKVLKPELAAIVGAERFLAEITTTANLTHPHILPLHDSGEADSFLFYVMPYVEGETLRDRIDREKQLPVDEAVALASKVAGALQHAHEHGVIHRDIKPANILLQDGEPVVSDFGIALAVGAAGSNRLTETGLSLGTPYYMSPEQATGDQTVGAATDIYALGAVLYEMLIGDPPYMGSTAQAILGRIIAGKVASATEERASVPANVDAAIRKALEKLPADRFTSAQDFARALADPAFRHGVEVEAGSGAGRGLWNPLSVALGALAVVFGLGFGWSTLRPAAPAPLPVSRQVISAAPGLPVVPSIIYTDVAISPDGQNIVYQSSFNPGQLAIRALDELESVTLRGPGDAYGPFLSPDGEWVAFQAGVGGSLQRVSILGGPPVTITPLPSFLFGASWGADDVIVFGLNDLEGLRQVPAAGGEPRSLTVTDGTTSHLFPDVLPNGAGVLFVVSNLGTTTDDQIAVLDLRTGE